jgi:hypothetical protein
MTLSKKLNMAESHALEDVVGVVSMGGVVEGANRGLASKRKRVDELSQQPVRHSPWEQDSLEALIEVLSGCLDGEAEALQQRRAVHDEERRLPEGSDSCWSGADSDSDSEAELGEGELVRLRQGPLQPDSRTPAVLGKRVQREEVPLHPRGLAHKRMRELHTSQEGQCKQQ